MKSRYIQKATWGVCLELADLQLRGRDLAPEHHGAWKGV